MRIVNGLCTTTLRAAALLLGLSSAPAAFAAPGSAPPAASAESTAVQALLRDGRWIDGRLVKLDSSKFTIRGSGAGSETAGVDIDRSEVVACVVDADRLQPLAFLTQASVGTLILTDGQFLPGALRTDTSSPRWEHRWIGSIPLKTDLISEIRLVATRRAPARPDSDSILLQNGDVVLGFVDSIGDEVVVEPADGGNEETDQPAKPSDGAQAPSKRRIQVERIAAIAFATLESPPADDALLWTTDGTIVRAKDISFDPDPGWRFLLADADLVGQADAKPISGVVTKPTAILLDRASITPLAACGPPKQSAAESSYRYETTPEARIDAPEQALLGLGSIELDGPTQASFRLPAAIADTELAFTAEIALVEPVPLDARTGVRVRFSGTAGETITLDSANRRAMVRLKQRVGPDASLEVIVDDGGNGTAGDRIAINRACFVRQR